MARRLLELQRATLLMYASCGWFFDDIAGLEASLVIRMGAHALDLLQRGRRDAADGRRARRAGGRQEQPPGRGDRRRRLQAGLRDRVTAAHAVGGSALETLVSPSAIARGDHRLRRCFTGQMSADANGTRTLVGRRARASDAPAPPKSWRSTRRCTAGASSPSPSTAIATRWKSWATRPSPRSRWPRCPRCYPTSRRPPSRRLMVAAAKGLPARRGDARGGGPPDRPHAGAAGIARPSDGRGPAPGHRAARGLDLPAGSPDRRALEERVWALLAQGRQTPPLRHSPRSWGSPSLKRRCRCPRPEVFSRDPTPTRGTRPFSTSRIRVERNRQTGSIPLSSNDIGLGICCAP